MYYKQTMSFDHENLLWGPFDATKPSPCGGCTHPHNSVFDFIISKKIKMVDNVNFFLKKHIIHF
jgi:hypothetical protein